MTTIVIRHTTPGGVDNKGDPVGGTSADTTVAGAFVAPRESTDVNDVGRVGVVIGLTLYLPYDTDIEHGDQVLVDDVLYEVDGEEGDWLQPMTGWQAGTTVALKRASG